MSGKTFIWEQNAEELCEFIKNSPALLRVVLKTKDDETLIERWIQHYSHIVNNAASILVFDNMSASKKVLDIYEKYKHSITLVKFSFYFNHIHSIKFLPQLYKAIWDSSLFYLFADTDEFLYLYDGKKIIGDKRILALLSGSADVNFFPTFWLRNAYCKDTVFSFKPDKEYIRYLVSMGKPILNSACARKKVQSIAAHALQMPLSMYGNAPACFLLFHLSTLSKEQRIRVNMDKLVQYGIIPHARDFHTVLNIDIDGISSGNVQYFIREIRNLLALPDTPEETIGPEHLEILNDGSLAFYPPSLKKTFDAYVNRKVSFFDILGITPDSIQDKNMVIWERIDKEAFDRKIPPQCKWEF